MFLRLIEIKIKYVIMNNYKKKYYSTYFVKKKGEWGNKGECQ